MDLYTPVVEQYRRFLPYTRDSPCFAAWTEGVLGDVEVQEWIARLPQIKQQPNLVFAAARWHGVAAPGSYAGLRTALLDDDGSIRDTILTRSTQTNEVGRLATLLPAFATIAARHGGAPLSLVEVGASAGLCLFPDRWGVTWRTESGEVRIGPEAPTLLPCQVDGPAPLPEALPAVAARCGVDLNPLDVTDTADDGDVAWLVNLVFPEHDDRREQLRSAVDLARHDPPRLTRGDLVAELPGLVAQAQAHGPVVVFHSAVIAYLEPPHRDAFAELMAGLLADGACHWVSNEGARALPTVAATGPVPPPELDRFVLGVDGRAVAWTHGHGRILEWHAPQE